MGQSQRRGHSLDTNAKSKRVGRQVGIEVIILTISNLILYIRWQSRLSGLHDWIKQSDFDDFSSGLDKLTVAVKDSTSTYRKSLQFTLEEWAVLQTWTKRLDADSNNNDKSFCCDRIQAHLSLLLVDPRDKPQFDQWLVALVRITNCNWNLSTRRM